MSDGENTAIKALGLTWDTERDLFLFTKSPPILQPWTLRSMTSSAGQLFDPLVLLGPATLPAKLLIQLAWRYQDDWDEELPESLAKKMTLYCKNQAKLDQIEISRHLGGISGRGKLVVFTDSSNLAQAAAAYWITDSAGKRDANLMMAKTKVTGIRQHEHIGRLELVAAVMGVALALKVALAFKIPMQEVTYFTDSMAVLYWLSTPAMLSAYVGHRVAKICERSKVEQWNYVNTQDNPSDLPTRGVRAADLAGNEMWWKGPKFLRDPRHLWPEQPSIRATEEAAAETRTAEEFAHNIVMGVNIERNRGPTILAQDFLDKGVGLHKAFRWLAAISEALRRRFSEERFVRTFRSIEHAWIRQEQEKNFQKLYHELRNQRRVTSLLELDPRLDPQGVIRVSAGLKNSLYHDWDTKFPILLHKNMKFTEDLLRYTHGKALGHLGGVSTLLTVLRKRYYIVAGKRAAVETIQQCFTCAKKSWIPLERKFSEIHGSRHGQQKPGGLQRDRNRSCRPLLFETRQGHGGRIHFSNCLLCYQSH